MQYRQGNLGMLLYVPIHKDTWKALVKGDTPFRVRNARLIMSFKIFVHGRVQDAPHQS